MGKRKLTLSISEDLLNEVKKILAIEGRSLSSVVEEYLEYLVFEKWIEELSRELGLDILEPTTENEIPSRRPRGYDSAKIVKELRNKRLEEGSL
ncbi:MAG: DUF6364 family protein [Thermoprotei archaeon]